MMRLVALYPYACTALAPSDELFQVGVEGGPPHRVSRSCLAPDNSLIALVDSVKHVVSKSRRNKYSVVVNKEALADGKVAPRAPESAEMLGNHV